MGHYERGNTSMNRVTKRLSMGALLMALLIGPLVGSDHADPIGLSRPEAGLTGLFAFPDGDRLIVVLAARPGLRSAPPLELGDLEYSIFMDLESEVDYSDAAARARYGGRVVHPGGISSHVEIRARLNADASLADSEISGLLQPERVRIWAGLRDDPFIFPPFFESNVVAIVVSIPVECFSEGQRDWLLWGTSSWAESGRQIDHVGRSSRTQQARFELLNLRPPAEHVSLLTRQKEKSDGLIMFLGDRVDWLSAVFLR